MTKYYRRGTSKSAWHFEDRRGQPLTPVEEQALAMLAGGLETTAISAQLGVSVPAVSRRCSSARAKLGAVTVIEAVVKYDRMKRR